MVEGGEIGGSGGGGWALSGPALPGSAELPRTTRRALRRRRSRAGALPRLHFDHAAVREEQRTQHPRGAVHQAVEGHPREDGGAPTLVHQGCQHRRGEPCGEPVRREQRALQCKRLMNTCKFCLGGGKRTARGSISVKRLRQPATANLATRPTPIRSRRRVTGAESM